MLNEYEGKRLSYNLAVNELNKYKKDYENKRLDISKKKFESECKKKEKAISELKELMDNYFDNNKDIIVDSMLHDQLEISLEYDFYNDEIIEENGNNYIYKKSKDEILIDIDKLKEKVQKRYDNKYITLIIYNDLNRCIDIYSQRLLNKLDSIDEKKLLSVVEKKEIKKKHKNNKKNENLLFKRLVLPLSVLDMICIVFILVRGGECAIGASEALSLVLCVFMVMSRLIVIFLTPVLVVYFIVKGISLLSKKKR